MMRINEFDQTVDEGVHDPHIFKAVFMAGAPGSGKSTVSKKLLSHTGLKNLNVDTFWQLYDQMGRDGDYQKYWQLYKAQEKNYIKGRLGLLIDGTARNPDAMAKIKVRLEELGYDCAMIFVNTSLETSLERTVSRANTPGKDMGRFIDSKFVAQAWQQIQNGLGKLQSMFGHNFLIVDNNKDLNLKYVDKAMRQWLSLPPYRPAAKEWIKSQGEQRRAPK